VIGEPVYGPYALERVPTRRRSANGPAAAFVGIHGTDEPQLIPGRPSHGLHQAAKRRHHPPVADDSDRHADRNRVRRSGRDCAWGKGAALLAGEFRRGALG